MWGTARPHAYTQVRAHPRAVSVLLTEPAAEGLGEREGPLAVGRRLHAVPQGPDALLPVAGEAGPPDLPHGGVAEVGHVGAHRCDGWAQGGLLVHV